MRIHTTIGRGCKLCAAIAAALLLAAGCSSVFGPSDVQPVRTASALVSYTDYDDLARALGFDMVQISGGGYVPISYSTIDGRVGQIIYTKDEAELNLRQMKGHGEITGVNAAQLSPKDVYGAEVEIGSYQDIQVATFQIKDSTYAMSATGMSAQTFEEIVTQIVSQLTAE